jgi:glycine/D-amino acid oxidase-like deaminating enzyme
MHQKTNSTHLINLTNQRAAMSSSAHTTERSIPKPAKNWGNSPWHIDFRTPAHELPDYVDFAIIGGGFTGLSAAARLASLSPANRIAVFEAETIGAGASGHTGGLALAETAAGDIPGLGDVLAGVSNIARELELNCDLVLPGVWEVDHATHNSKSPISWNDDSGKLRVANEVPGGTIDPGKMVSELARAAVDRGAHIFESARVEDIQFGQPAILAVRGKRVQADRVLVATNALSLELSALSKRAEPKFTLALATAPLTQEQLQSLGLASGKPFYTTDLPYLWGRLWQGNRIIFGSGLVHANDWRELLALDVNSDEAARLLKNLERRLHAFHPALSGVQITHKWGGPILIANKWQPVFAHHPKSDRTIVLGAYSGHGVMLSVYLGAWAAEGMLGQREIPGWNAAD